MFENRRMPNGMSERARSQSHAVLEGVPCKGALDPIFFVVWFRPDKKEPKARCLRLSDA